MIKVDGHWRHTEKEKKKIRKALHTKEWKQQQSKFMSERNRRSWQDPAYRKMMSPIQAERARKEWKDPECRERIIAGSRGKRAWNKNLTKETDERVRKYSESLKGKNTWTKNRKWSKKEIQSILRRRIPSSLEKKFQVIINKHNLPYKFTGDGSFILAGCNPDFINTNNEKVAIEVYARYFKELNGRNILRWKHVRRQKFAKFGWKIIFFDKTQVKEEFVLETLKLIGKNN